MKANRVFVRLVILASIIAGVIFAGRSRALPYHKCVTKIYKNEISTCGGPPVAQNQCPGKCRRYEVRLGHCVATTDNVNCRMRRSVNLGVRVFKGECAYHIGPGVEPNSPPVEWCECSYDDNLKPIDIMRAYVDCQQGQPGTYPPGGPANVPPGFWGD